MSASAVKFYFVAGPHAGSSLQLPPGDYTLGNSPECDLQIREETEILLQLHISPELQVTVKVQKGTAVLQGKAVGESPVPFAEGALLTAGFTVLTHGEAEKVLSRLNLADLGATEQAPAQPPQAEAQSTAQSAAVAEPAVAAAPASSLPAENAAVPESETEQAQAVERGPRHLWLYLVCGLCVLAAAFSALVAGSFLYGERAQHRQMLAEVEDYLQQGGFTLVQAEYKPDTDTLWLTGTVSSQQERQALSANMPALPVPVVLQVEVLDSTLNSIQKALATRGVTASARYEEGNRIGLFGFIADPYIESGVLSQVLPQLPQGVTAERLQPHFTHSEAMLSLLQQLQQRYKLPLEFTCTDFAVRYEGQLTFAQLQQFAALQREVSEHAGGKVLFVQAGSAQDDVMARVGHNVTALNSAQQIAGPNRQSRGTERNARTEAGFDPSEVAGVTLQPLRFITLRNGEKYFEGAVLPGGALLQNIDLDKLTVVNAGGKEVVYELN